MFPSSERFEHGVVYGHDVVTRCEVVDSKNTHVIKTLDVIGGSVSMDASRKTRRQCSLTLQDPTGDLIANDVDALLRPYSGHFIRVARGIRYRDGTEEYMPLGTFAPYSPKATDTDESLEITVDGYDRSKIIGRTRWTQPYVITKGTNTATAIRDLLETRMPGLRYDLTPTNSTVPGTTLGTEAENDPWDDATKLANADGMELFFDSQDVVTLRPIPDPANDPVVRTYVDDETCTVTQFRRAIDADKMYTGVIVYSEGSDVEAPIRVEVWRDDTNLRIPYFFPTSLITSEAQAIATGESLLHVVGRAELTAELTAIPDPRQEVGDVIRIVRGRAKLNHTFLVENMTMPMDSENEMTINTSSVRFP